LRRGASVHGLTAEVNAAVEGARAGGADEVAVKDPRIVGPRTLAYSGENIIEAYRAVSGW
jgi:D-aminopeptidase